MKWRGAIVGAASGAMGSIVASRNKGGQYLRARVVPSGSVPTTQQGVIRNAVASIASLWQSLTGAQREVWTVYAANVFTVDSLGDSIQNSGFNWFTASNVVRIQIAGSLCLTGPDTFDRGEVSFSGTTLVCSGSRGTLSLASSPLALGLTSNDYIPVYVGRPYSPGRTKYFGSFQLATTVAGNSSASTFAFNLPFVLTDTTNKMEARITVSRGDGRITTPFRITCNSSGT